MRSKMKILVTGGAGFIGSQVADAFINEGHEVVIIDDLSTGFEKNINPKAEFIQMSICDENVKKIFIDQKFDVVNHHAAQIDVRKSVADPGYDATINIIGTINLLENCVRMNVKKFMFASTGGAIYGEQQYYPADENHREMPVSPYGISKLAIEKYLYYYFVQYKLAFTVLRYANIYGPRQNPFGEAGVVAIFVNKLLKNDQPLINGDGKQTRDYVFVEDVVNANLLMLNSDREGIFNIGTGIETDVNELFNELASIMKLRMNEKHGPPAKGEQLRSVISSEKIFNEFGWKPSVTLSDGLRKTVDYFREEKT
jgi:UDP-glucose 4-epimerase